MNKKLMSAMVIAVLSLAASCFACELPQVAYTAKGTRIDYSAKHGIYKFTGSSSFGTLLDASEIARQIREQGKKATTEWFFNCNQPGRCTAVVYCSDENKNLVFVANTKNVSTHNEWITSNFVSSGIGETGKTLVLNRFVHEEQDDL